MLFIMLSEVNLTFESVDESVPMQLKAVEQYVLYMVLFILPYKVFPTFESCFFNVPFLQNTRVLNSVYRIFQLSIKRGHLQLNASVTGIICCLYNLGQHL